MRVEVRAVIVENGLVLLTKERRREGQHLALPGGRVKRGETIPEALRREVMEETGLEIQPGPLLYVLEATGRNRLQDLNLIFAAEPSGRADPDRCELVDPSRVGGEAVLPPILAEIERDIATGWRDTPRWLGNVWNADLA